jgi:hypothetical protein
MRWVRLPFENRQGQQPAVDSKFRIGGFLCILFLALYPFLFRQAAAGVC